MCKKEKHYFNSWYALCERAYSLSWLTMHPTIKPLLHEDTFMHFVGSLYGRSRIQVWFSFGDGAVSYWVGVKTYAAALFSVLTQLWEEVWRKKEEGEEALFLFNYYFFLACVLRLGLWRDVERWTQHY